MQKIDFSKEKGLKVLFIHLSNAPISFYRMVQFADEMAGYEDMYPFYNNFNPFEQEADLKNFEVNPEKFTLPLNALVQQADLIIAQTVHGYKFLDFLKMMKDLYGKPILTELDDDPLNISYENPGFEKLGPESEIQEYTLEQIYSSDALIVSTEHLKNLFINHPKKVFVIPNCLNENLWKFEKKQRNEKEIVIGWSGANGHLKDLNIVKGAIEKILEKYENVKVKFIGGGTRLVNHKRFEMLYKMVPIIEYPKFLAEAGFDIGIAPLWDSEFNRSKSNLRYLEYSILNLPSVCSRVEPYKKTILDGVDGYLASTQKEWIDKLSILIEDKNKAEEISNKAFVKVTTEYNLKSISRKYADILKEFYGNYKGSQNVNLQTTSG